MLILKYVVSVIGRFIVMPPRLQSGMDAAHLTVPANLAGMKLTVIRY